MAKPLEWTEESSPNESCPYDHTQALTPFGYYRITWKSWKDYPSYGVDFGEEYIVEGNTLSLAKEAAQADYDRRVLDATAVTNGERK